MFSKGFLQKAKSKSKDNQLLPCDSRPAKPPLDQQQDLSIKHFSLERCIGEGNFSEVHLAVHKQTGQQYAIKTINKDKVTRLGKANDVRMERHIGMRVKEAGGHPNILPLVCTFKDAWNVYLVYEVGNGGDLWEAVKGLGCLSQMRARRYVGQLVKAVQFLHSLRIVHRDIKAENVVICGGVIKMLDFGTAVDFDHSEMTPSSNQARNRHSSFLPPCARPPSSSNAPTSTSPTSPAIHQPHHDHINGRASPTPTSHSDKREVSPCMEADGGRRGVGRQTAVGGSPCGRGVFEHYVGTPQFMPPEAISNMNSDQPRDLWSLGCTIYQILAGIPPFHGSTDWFVFNKIVNMELEFPPGFPEEAEDLVRRLVVENPTQRLGAISFVGQGGKAMEGDAPNSNETASQSSLLQPIISHSYFNPIREDWDRLHLLPPVVPCLSELAMSAVSKYYWATHKPISACSQRSETSGEAGTSQEEEARGSSTRLSDLDSDQLKKKLEPLTPDWRTLADRILWEVDRAQRQENSEESYRQEWLKSQQRDNTEKDSDDDDVSSQSSKEEDVDDEKNRRDKHNHK
eukprot:GHVS01030081.1.p1 GENE.GHVS01030081.1~~GHVS01030081.1.p1  ORF type:complete len:571 (+),score=93.93 GHVS01030081.1:137-1849(+)